jgi:asparagine synthase (glutamine-hydrolysing)
LSIKTIWGAANPRFFLTLRDPFDRLGDRLFESSECLLGLSAGLFADNSAFLPTDSKSSLHLRITGDIELHNSADLSRMLSADIDRETDASLVLLAYRKWGIDCPSYLRGEFTFAIWDEQARQLFLSQDHLGSRPLYHWAGEGRFVFATDPTAILDFPGVPRRLNRKKLASMAGPSGWQFENETLHLGIQALSPGTCLTFNRSETRVHRYWKPEPHSGLIPRHESEAFERLRELVFSSVRNRVRRKRSVGVWLSGGLDSSAIAAVAAQCLAESNRELIALSAVVPDEHLGRVNDEREYAEEFRTWPNVRLKYVTAQGRGPFDLLDKPEEMEACVGTSSRRYLSSALEDASVADGVDTILNGTFGEFSVTTKARGYYAELAVRLRWIELGRQLRDRRTVSAPQSPLLRAFPPLVSEILDVFVPFRRRQPSVFLAAEFVREYQTETNRSFRWPDHRSLETARIGEIFLKHPTRHLSGGPRRLRYTYPFLDKDLLEFCISAPGSMKFRNGYSRYMVRRSLDGVLPRKIQWRTTKAPFAPDYFIRFNSQLPRAKEFIESIPSNDPVRSIVDVSRIWQSLVPVDAVLGTFDALCVPVNLYLICFLRQFAEFQL